jgi:alpha-tubulin suppressor-like RCC1 family protein
MLTDATFDERADGGADASARLDSGEDAGALDAFVTPDSSCELGTLENCTRCGESCVWSCTPSGCNDPVAVSVGQRHACVARRVSGIAAWGDNSNSVLGDGSTIDSTVPVEAAFGGQFVDVCAGGSLIGSEFSCALSASGIVSCWGSNGFGCLGPDAPPDSSPTPVVVDLSDRAAEIDCGYFFACARLESGEVSCWGTQAEVGGLTPRRIGGLTARATRIAVGDQHACALLETGAIQCWGGNGSGELGDRTTSPSANAVDVEGVSAGATLVSAGARTSCAASDSGDVLCWGEGYGSSPVVVPGVASPLALGPACAGLPDGVVCWPPGGAATRVAGTAGPFVEIASIAAPVTCGRTERGAVYCWGNGHLGSSTMSSAAALLVGPPSER